MEGKGRPTLGRVLVLCVVTACFGALTTAAAEASWSGKYAAIGDSYSSGDGAPGYYGQTNTPSGETGEQIVAGEAAPPPNTNECLRSARAYPARIAEALYPGEPSNLSEAVILGQQPAHFIFRACAGAVVENLWGGGAAAGQWNEWNEDAAAWLPTPAQDLWLELPGGEPNVTPQPNSEISLVTLTIGGNDAGFAKVIGSCIMSTSTFLNGFENFSKAACDQVIGEWEKGENGGSGHGPVIPSNAEGIPSIAAKLVTVLENIHQAAPNAKIEVLEYAQFLDPAGAQAKTSFNVGGTPVLGIPLGSVKISGLGSTEFFIANETKSSKEVAPALVKWIKKTNGAVGKQVKKWSKAHGKIASVVKTSTAFAGHELGDWGPGSPELWTNGLVWRPATVTAEQPKASDESFHPACSGHIALAEKVLAALAVAVPGGWSCP